MTSKLSTLSFALQLIAATLYSFGAVAMKRSEGLTKLWPSALLLACFCAGAALHALAMKHAEMSITYIVVLGLEAALTFALSVAIFGESAHATKLLGIGLIMSGIYVINR